MYAYVYLYILIYLYVYIYWVMPESYFLPLWRAQHVSRVRVGVEEPRLEQLSQINDHAQVDKLRKHEEER